MADLILLIESSGAQCSVALLKVDTTEHKLVAELDSNEKMNHTAVLVPLIKELMQSCNKVYSDLSAVAVSAGPGSYSGLRAGYSTAKGLCFALSIPLISISTLESLASSIPLDQRVGSNKILSVLPARRLEIYRAMYSHENEVILHPDCIVADESWLESIFSDKGIILVAPEASSLSVKWNLRIPFVDLAPKAKHLAVAASRYWRLAQFEEIMSAQPAYIKPPFITQAKPRI